MKKFFVRSALPMALLMLSAGTAMGQLADKGRHKDLAPLPDDVAQQVFAASRVTGSGLGDDLGRVMSPVVQLLADIKANESQPGVMDMANRRTHLVGAITQLNAFSADLGRRGSGVMPSALLAGTQQKIQRVIQLLQAIQSAPDAQSLKGALDKALSGVDGLYLAPQRDLAQSPLSNSPNWTLQGPIKPVKQSVSATKPAYEVAKLSSNRLSVHMLATTGNLTSAPATPAEASSCSYVAADLAETEEVKLTTEIRNLAQSLNYSPVQIYQWVYDNIKFEPYYGSLKGATGTLYAKAGGATDQASLLIALLRASNVPARFVKGQIAVLDDTALDNGTGRAQRWLGAKGYAGSANILAAGQNPGAGTFSLGSTTQGIQLTHVWVEACLPYGHYRGTRIDMVGHRWLPLDASFKDQNFRAGINTGASLDYGTTGTGFLAKRTTDLPQEVYARTVLAAAKSLAPNYNNNTLLDVANNWTANPRRVDVLPATLPYTVWQFLAWDGGTGPSEVADLPDRHRYKYTITSKNVGGTALATTTLSMPANVLKRVTLSYAGATTTDQTNFNTWQAGTAAIPTTINVVPVIKVDGVEAVRGTTSVTLDTKSNGLVMALTLGDLGQTTLSTCPKPVGAAAVNCITYSNIGAANYHALQAYAFQASDRLLAERATKLAASVRANPTAPNANGGDETTGEFLHLVSLKYMRYISDAGKLAGALDGGSGEPGNHLGLASTQARITYLFDQPFEVKRDGYLIDVPGGQSRSGDLVTGKSVWKTFKLTGYASSAYESYIWQENARLDAVSTVRGLQFAAESGIEILTINSGNKTTQLPKLTANGAGVPGCAPNVSNTPGYTAGAIVNYSAQQQTDIGATVDAGNVVTIPRCLIQYGNWNGAVYAAELDNSATTGTMSALFAINQYAGGYTTQALPSISYNSYSNSGWYTPSYSSLASYITPASLVNVGNGSSIYNTYSGDPVNMVTGNMYHNETDINIKGRGLPLIFSRAYNSRALADGPLGFGWTHSFNHYLRFDDDNLDGAANAADTDNVTSSVTWVDGSGAEKGITVAGTTSGVAIGATFTPPQGNYFTVARKADGTYQITEKSGLVYTFQSVAGTVGQKAKLTTIADRNGNTLTLTYNGTTGLLDNVADGVSTARKLTFSYNGTRISQIADWTGRFWQYFYDGSFNLTSYKTPLAVVGNQPAKAYTYYADTSVDSTSKASPINHAIKTIVDQRGNTLTFEYYLNGKVFRHTNSSGYASTFTYNDFRRESVHIDERGSTRHFFFDQYGNPIRTIEADGTELNYSYYTGTTGDNNPYLRKTVTNAAGYVTQYAYDTSGNLTTTTLPDSNTIVGSNFLFGQAGKVKDARNNYRMTKFDAKGNPLQSLIFKAGVGAALDPTTYTPAAADLLAWSVNTFDAYGNVLTSTKIRDFAAQVSTPGNQNGPRLTYSWNDTVNGVNGLNLVTLTSSGDTNGDGVVNGSDTSSVINRVYDALGRTVSSTQGAYTVVSSYDLLDRVTQTVDALNYVHGTEMDDGGNVTRQTLTDDKGVLVWQGQYRYDLSGNQVSSTDSAGNVSLATYDGSGNVLTRTNADNYSVSTVYDSMERAIKAFDAAGNMASSQFDALGRVVSLTDPNGSTTQSVYYDGTKGGRLKQRLDATGRAATYDYDANGNIVSVTDNAGRISTTAYDALNRPTRVVGALYTDAVLGAAKPLTTFTYDNLGNRTQTWMGYISGTTDNLTVQRTETFDDFGRKLTAKDALNQTTQFAYDVYGNVTRVTDAKNQVTNMVYGYAGQLKSVTDHLSRVTNYTYNALGQPLTVAGPNVTYTYEYDGANRLKAITDSRGGKKINYTYSPGGKLVVTQDSDSNRTDYLYDTVGRLIGIWAPNLDYVSLSWDAGGRLTEKWVSNGVNSVYSYYADGTLKSLKNRMGYSDANIISKHDFTYNNVAQRQTQVETIGAVTNNYTYNYDELTRLTSVAVTGSNPYTESYSYDPLNNRRSKTDASGTVAYVYDVANQLKEVRQGTTTGTLLGSLGYDANGNMTTTYSGWTLGYDVVNQLTSATKSGQSSQTYTYDHLGRRISKAVGSTTTNYLVDGGNIVGEFDNQWGAAQVLYTHGGGVDDHFLRVASGAATYYHQDGLGSVVATSNASGASTGTQRYDVYGNSAATTGTAIPRFGYAGREPDETGLTYNRARFYDPSVGRFTQRDPIGLRGGINLYAYVSGNPVNFTDPSGTTASGSLASAINSYLPSYSSFSSSSINFNTPTYTPPPALTTTIDFGYKDLNRVPTWDVGTSASSVFKSTAETFSTSTGTASEALNASVDKAFNSMLSTTWNANNLAGDKFNLGSSSTLTAGNFGVTAGGSLNGFNGSATATNLGTNKTNLDLSLGYKDTNFGIAGGVTGATGQSPTGNVTINLGNSSSGLYGSVGASGIGGSTTGQVTIGVGAKGASIEGVISNIPFGPQEKSPDPTFMLNLKCEGCL